MEVELGGGAARKAKGWSVGVVVAGVLLALVDALVLRGEHVASARVDLSGSDAAVIAIARPGEEHLVKISTRRRRHGETEGRSIDYRLEDPEGRVVAEWSEVLSRKRRYLRFVPEVPGDYRLFVEDESLFGSRRGGARITVTVNDHRVFGPRIFSALPF